MKPSQDGICFKEVSLSRRDIVKIELIYSNLLCIELTVYK